jgi:Icc-related predicted phosphoesterase
MSGPGRGAAGPGRARRRRGLRQTGAVRVLLAGDWHGNREFCSQVLSLAATQGAPTVLQLGDFGLWPGRHDAWLDHVEDEASRTGTEVYWVDGNHEDHDQLDRWRAEAGGGLVHLRPRVWWASRGSRWEWAGFRFGALGGAVSADRFLRTPGRNWWPQEQADQADVDRLGDRPLDVLVAHAAPSGHPAPPRPLRLPATIAVDIAVHRALLDQAVARTRPRLVVHGHYHRRLRANVGGRLIEGLAHDRAPLADACAVLDLSPSGAVEVSAISAPGDGAGVAD